MRCVVVAFVLFNRLTIAHRISLGISLAHEVGWESNMEVEDGSNNPENEAFNLSASFQADVMAAILDGQLLKLKSLVEEGDFRGEMLPMLEAAARSGDVEILKFLCQKLGGQRVNLRCCCGGVGDDIIIGV